MLLYLDQEGRSHGLVEKVAQLDLISQGLDTVEAAAQRGRAADLRTYDDAAAILRALVGATSYRLLTNNPAKLALAEQAGIGIEHRVQIEPPPTSGNREYLRTKKLKMGHLLESV